MVRGRVNGSKDRVLTCANCAMPSRSSRPVSMPMIMVAPLAGSQTSRRFCSQASKPMATTSINSEVETKSEV